MTQSTLDQYPSGSTGAASRPERAGLLWLASTGLALLGAWLLYAAAPGLNWLLWTVAVVAGLIALEWQHRAAFPKERWIALGLGCCLAGTAAVTADPLLHAMQLVAIAWLGAAATVLNAGLSPARLGPAQLVAMPFQGAVLAMQEAGRRADRSMRAVASERNVPRLRGIALALPVVIIFFLLLAEADPTLRAWRAILLTALRDVAGLPRILFTLVLGTVSLGFYGIALRDHPAAAVSQPAAPPRATRTAIERSIVFGSVAALFAIYLALQASYLFGNPGGRSGTGITYAEAVHRGFAEITLVATLAGLLIVVLDRNAVRASREALVRGLGYILIGECLLLLVSAHQRLDAYETAYGYTVLRVFVHVYMAGIAASLLLLARELSGRIDVPRLARRVAVTATVTLGVLSCWNYAAWIVRHNFDRSASNGQIDLDYFATGAGPDAIPEVVALLQRLPASDRARVLRDLQVAYGSALAPDAPAPAWFEWSLRRAAARRALAGLSVASPPDVRPAPDQAEASHEVR
jgi:hypothetical protein